MIRFRQRKISVVLLLLMLLSPVTSMGMQLSTLQTGPEPCHEMMKHGDSSLVESKTVTCAYMLDCQQSCCAGGHCSTTSSVINHPFVFHSASPGDILSLNAETQLSSLFPGTLYRPPRA